MKRGTQGVEEINLKHSSLNDSHRKKRPNSDFLLSQSCFPRKAMSKAISGGSDKEKIDPHQSFSPKRRETIMINLSAGDGNDHAAL